jgi:acyl-coenzyme A thioesterase PaaI-like protein
MKSEKPPEVRRESGWQEIALPYHIGSGRTMFTAEGLRLKVFFRPADQHLIGRVWFGEVSHGPPGHAHGGAIAYVLDEAMGSVAWMNAYPVVAARLEFEYFHMTPLQEDLEVEAWIAKVTGRRLDVEATIKVIDDGVTVTARGQFARLSRARVAALGSKEMEAVLKDPKIKWAE